ncbi:hypothetical protein JVU11DRAFT_4605 [Chiua virens]|nr:hypothetical protein JVU11DRAFT_4605 [Chiua virens]
MLRTTATSLACYAGLANAWSTFIVPHIDSAVDTPALTAAISEYASDASLGSPITFPKLTNVDVAIEGNLSCKHPNSATLRWRSGEFPSVPIMNTRGGGGY